MRVHPRLPSLPASCPVLRRSLVAFALLLNGCAVGPDFRRPDPPAAGGYESGSLPNATPAAAADGTGVQIFRADLDIPAQWWGLFHSDALNALVQEALKGNRDLAGARAALIQAQENALAQGAAFYPTVQVGYSASRQRNANGTLSPALSSGEALYNLHTAQVNVAYVADVFGGNRRLYEALNAQTEVQRFQVEATYLTLTSNLVTAALTEASLRAQIDASEDILQIETHQLELLRRALALGAIAESDVLAQQALLAQTRALLPPLRRQLAQQKHLISALVGRLPGEDGGTDFELSGFQLPAELPVTLPAQLIEHRPDIRAAEAQLHAASALLGVAEANRLPQFTLAASMGGTATQISQLLSSGNTFWSVGASVAQTLLDGGALMHRQRGAAAAYEQAAAQYRGVVLTACQNVADVLQALQQDAEALKATAEAEQAARASLDVAQRAAGIGSTGYLAVLGAEQSYQQAHISLVQAQASRYADTAALFQALGGGWWQRPDAVAEVVPR